MDTVTEVKLSSGMTLKCRKVPPYALNLVHRRIPEPPFPQVTIESAAGSEESKPALPGSPEFAEYRNQMREYRKQLTLLTMQFYLNYGIVSWRRPGDDASWQTQPPEDWELDPVLAMYGEKISNDAAERRYQYITYELLLNDADSDIVEEAVGVKTQPVTKEEVTAATTPFESGTQETVQ